MNTIPVKDFIYGQIDTLEDRSLPRGAASEALNWITRADRIVLRGGYKNFGNEISGAGKITGLKVAKRSDGVEVRFRTRGKKLEYYNPADDTWTEIGTNVLGNAADGKEISMDEYHSLAGDQLFVSSPYGPLIKIMLANPGSYADMYNSAKNYKGYIKIKQNRMWLWGRLKDKAAPYLSFIDAMDYTTVSDENIGTGDGSEKTFTETLDFKAGGAKRTCFGIEVTDGVEIFTDNYDGTLTGDKGGTGTINYMTGAISVTFNTAPGNTEAILADYQWEDSTNGGICDFTFTSPTRVAGEGTVFRQDEGGGPLQTIESYGDEEYCIHEKKTWVLTLTSDDTNATNLIYREKVGIPNFRGSVSTADGIYYVDDSDETDPQIRLLTIPPMMDKVIPVSISKGFKYKSARVGIDLSDYRFDKAAGREWGDYIVFACRASNSSQNNRLLLYNKKQKTIDIQDLFAQYLEVSDGKLIAGDSVTSNVYFLFDGYDDETATIGNSWVGNKDNLDFEGYKKIKKIRVKGEIGPEQDLKIWASVDDGDFVEIGTITGSELSGTEAGIIGRGAIGTREIGGGSEGDEYSTFIEEFSATILGKFNTIKIKVAAQKLGFCSLSEFSYHDIRIKSRKIKTT